MRCQACIPVRVLLYAGAGKENPDLFSADNFHGGPSQALCPLAEQYRICPYRMPLTAG